MPRPRSARQARRRVSGSDHERFAQLTMLDLLTLDDGMTRDEIDEYHSMTREHMPTCAECHERGAYTHIHSDDTCPYRS